MSELLKEHWTDVLALAVALGAVWKYFLSRKDELAWRRSEMIFKLGDRLDTDPRISRAIDLLYDRFPGTHVTQLFSEEGQPHEALHPALLSDMDTLLNFLARISHAHLKLQALSIAEVQTFGAHFQSIVVIDRLRRYCANNGYSDVVTMAERIVSYQDSD
jgi:hypothetical protein